MDPVDPRRIDRTDAAAPRDPSAGEQGELIRITREESEILRGQGAAPSGSRAGSPEPPIISMAYAGSHRHYEMPRPRSGTRRPSSRWKWVVVGAGAGLASALVAIGLGWAVGTTKLDEGAGEQQAMVEALGALQQKVATLEKTSAHNHAATVDAAQLRATLARLAARFDAGAGKTSQRLSHLSSQLEKLDAQSTRENAARLSEIGERLDRIHHQIATLETTGSIAKPTAAPPSPTARAAYALPPSAVATKELRPPEAHSHLLATQRPLDNWVLRGVHDGAAVVVGAHGVHEVAPGALLPGAGRVKSIERHGANWVVLTTAGIIERAE
ncbi:MAG: hypothetical protein WB816_10230 [Methylocystis sp.]